MEETFIKRKGSREYRRFKKKEKLSYYESILAQCYVCYVQGADPDKLDCNSKVCPLYAYMPYNPSRHKKTLNLNEHQRRKIAERFNKVALQPAAL